MSRTRILRLVAAGVVLLAGPLSLRLLETRPGGLEYGCGLWESLPELLTFAAIFLPLLLAGPVCLLCAGALFAGRGSREVSEDERRRWRWLLVWWLVGLMLPRLAATMGGWILMRTIGLPVVLAIGLVAVIVVAVRWQRKELDKRVVLAMVLVLVVPWVSWLFSWRGHGYLPGWTFVAVAVMLAAALAGGRLGRWLLLIGLVLAGLGLPRAWRSHMEWSLLSLIPVGVAAVMVWAQARKLLQAGPGPAARLGLRLAPFALALTWLGISALGGDNCVLVAYLVGLRDPFVDMASCSGLYPSLTWDLASLYRGLLFLGALPVAPAVLYWLPRTQPRRRWGLALACLALVPALEVTLLRGIPRHFGGMAFEAVARASAETKETMIAAGTGLYGYEGLGRGFEYGELYDPIWESEWLELDEIPDRFMSLLLEPPRSAPAGSPRRWFPETMLFEPLVVTDEQGLAAIEVPVPDQLTSWRLLALAHSRSGRQAGVESSFLSTLPLSVDLGRPPTLRVGDRVALPVWVSNNDDEPWGGALHVSVSGAESAGVHDVLELAPRSSALRWVQVTAAEPGRATISARAGEDFVEQSFEVQPTGRALRTRHGGSLGGPRSVDVVVPHGSLPGGTLALTVVPGPVGFLAGEAAREAGPDAASQAWALAANSRGAALAERLGAEVDVEAGRDARLRALLELSRSLHMTVSESIMLLEASAGSDEPTAVALADRAVDKLARGQGPDGSYAISEASLERSLVLSADAARVAQERAPIVSLKAAGFIERHAPRITDPCTAAVLASSGVVGEPLLAELRAMVREAVQVREYGGAELEPGLLSRRADGLVPTTVECTARAITALAGDPDAEPVTAELGTALLAGWDPEHGFGDGVASLAVLAALEALYDQPLHERSSLAVRVDGVLVRERPLDPRGQHEPVVVVLPALTGAGAHSVQIEASPPIPGLGFSLEQWHWVPWEAPALREGLDLRVEAPREATVGLRSPCRLIAALPAGQPARVQLELPAGVEVDLESVRASGVALDGVRLDADVLTLRLEAVAQGATVAVGFDLLPTLAGTLHWGAARVELVDGLLEVPVGSMVVKAATMDG